MFVIYIPAALLFRSGSVSQAVQLVGGLFTSGGGLTSAFDTLGMTGLDVLRIGVFLVCMYLIYPLTLEESERKPLPLSGYVYGVLLIACCWLALLATQGNAAFAYFQF